MPAFNLKLPNIEVSEPEHYAQPKNLEVQIAKLADTSSTRTAKTLYRIIKNLNRTRISPQIRMQLTELLASPINKTTRILENNYIEVSFPLPIAIKHTAFICTHLAEELTFTYKWVIEDLIQNTMNYTERRLMMSALFYAVYRLNRLIYAYSLLYKPPPPSTWVELHTLFRFADTNNLAITPHIIHIKATEEATNCTLRDVYIQILLFAVAAPARLCQQDMRSLYLKLLRWGKVVKLQSLVNATPADTLFFVQPQTDRPPQHSTLVGELCNEVVLELDTWPLIKILQEHLNKNSMGNEIQTSGPANKLSAVVMRSLIRAWGNTPQRQFSRTKINFTLPLIVGFKAVYNLLMSHHDSQQDELAVPDTDFAESRNSLELQDPLENAFSNFDNISINYCLNTIILLHDADKSNQLTIKDPSPHQKIWIDMKESGDKPITTPAPKPPFVKLNTINESIGGYCVDWNKHHAPVTKVGKLVGILEPIAPPTCALAMVRWIYDVPEQGLQVGLQILSPKVIVTTIIHKTKNDNITIPCLLITELKNLNSPTSLITSLSAPLHVESGKDEALFLQERDTVRGVQLMGLIESGDDFARFSFKYL